jgi:hypothetical protein
VTVFAVYPSLPETFQTSNALPYRSSRVGVGAVLHPGESIVLYASTDFEGSFRGEAPSVHTWSGTLWWEEDTAPSAGEVVFASDGEDTTKGLSWFPINWPSGFDVMLGEGGEVLPIQGGGSLVPPGVVEEFGDDGEESVFHPLLQLLAEAPDQGVVVSSPEGVWVISPPDGWERDVLLDWASAWVAPDEGGALPAILPWTVWRIQVKDLLDEIQYHMLEATVDGGQTWQFSAWTASRVEKYLRERVTRWLYETRFVRSRQTFTTVAGEGEYALDSAVSLLQRVYATKPLSRVDRWMLDHSNVGWEGASGAPAAFVEDTGSVRLTPTPQRSAAASYIFVPTTPVEGGAVFIFNTLTIPATFSWGVKYGVMADMLMAEGEGNDPTRAAYCETRFADSVALARMMMGESVGAK